ncbi:MAG: carbohydrate ABC transporter permease [Oscillospiraceae bacterium]|nr:carbohydrate ABC transporter permease [Oscillospiraceae bacterium]
MNAISAQGGRREKIRHSMGDRIYYAVSKVLLTLLWLIIAYPVVYVLSASFSSGIAVSSGQVVLWPVDLSLESYRAVFQHPDIMTGYRNTIFYTVTATTLNVAMTMIAAYPLSRGDMPGRNGFMFLFSFTMWFSGGLIPFYILMSNMRMINTVWVMIIPGAISVYNMILVRTFLANSIPKELLEAATIDGCSDAGYFIYMLLPLAKAVIAVITLFYAVGHWNQYFNGFIYLINRKLMPLQVILREVLVKNQIDMTLIADPELAVARQGLADVLKHALIVVATVPILCVYPFIQRYFVQGVMIGSIKG